MRNSIRRAAPLVALLALAVGCDVSPTDPPPLGASLAPAIQDAANGGRAGFYFVPPTVTTTPAFSGVFDAGLAPQLTVEVCELDASGACPAPPVATFTSASSSYLTAIRVNPVREFYVVYWNVDAASAGPGRVFRARVLGAGVELGYTDFPDPAAGAWLPIAFRIEEGALDESDPPPPAEVTSNADGSRVGSGLQHGPWSLVLGTVAPAGGVEVEVRSGDPSRLLVSPDAATAGADRIVVAVPGGSDVGTFWVQGVEGATGVASLEFVADGFEGNATVEVVPVAAELVGLGASRALAGPDVPFQVRIGAVDETGAGLYAQQGVRAGGVPIPFTVSNSDAAVARLVTGAGAAQVGSVVVEVGAWLSAPDVAGGGIAFDPLGPGTTTVSLSHADVTLLEGATREVTVTAGLTVASTGVRVGAGLQHLVTVVLDAPAPAGGVTIQLESSDPGVLLLAPTAATPASATISVTANAGTGGAGFYVAGLEGATGTATVTATAAGYTTGVGTVTVTPAGVRLLFLGATQTAGGPSDPFRVQVGAVNQNGTGLYTEQDVRAGGTPIVVDVTSSDAAVAQLVTAAGAASSASVTIPVGLGRSPADVASGGVELDPLAPGQTTVHASGAGLVPVPGASLVVTVQ